MDSSNMISVYDKFEDLSEREINFALAKMRLTPFKDSMEDMSIYIGEDCLIKSIDKDGI
jgi:hypothetical protein